MLCFSRTVFEAEVGAEDLVEEARDGDVLLDGLRAEGFGGGDGAGERDFLAGWRAAVLVAKGSVFGGGFLSCHFFMHGA